MRDGVGRPAGGSEASTAKRAAAEAAAALVETGMTLGLGSGSTAAAFVRAVGARAATDGLALTCVASSETTEAIAREVGLKIASLDDHPVLDLAVDGADEIDDGMRLIKGGGGALLREKMVAAAARRFVVIADASKQVAGLGAFPLPVEVTPFGWKATKKRIAELLEVAPSILGAPDAACDFPPATPKIALRGNGTAFRTDEGNFILDLSFGRIHDPAALSLALLEIPGVIETGLFLNEADAAIIGSEDGSVRVLERPHED